MGFEKLIIELGENPPTMHANGTITFMGRLFESNIALNRALFPDPLIKQKELTLEQEIEHFETIVQDIMAMTMTLSNHNEIIYSLNCIIRLRIEKIIRDHCEQ